MTEQFLPEKRQQTGLLGHFLPEKRQQTGLTGHFLPEKRQQTGLLGHFLPEKRQQTGLTGHFLPEKRQQTGLTGHFRSERRYLAGRQPPAAPKRALSMTLNVLRRRVGLKIGDNYYTAKINIGIKENGKSVLYQIN